MATRKSPKPARDANPQNKIRKAEREHNKLKMDKSKPLSITKTPQKEIDATNKRLSKHYAGQKSPPHTIKVNGIGKKGK